MIEPPKSHKNALRELKVKVPVAHHIWLHALKIRDGQPISETIQVALREYIARHLEAGERGPLSDPSEPSIDP